MCAVVAVTRRVDEARWRDVEVVDAEIYRRTASRGGGDLIARLHLRPNLDGRQQQNVIVVVHEGLRHLHHDLGVARRLGLENEGYGASSSRIDGTCPAILALTIPAPRVNEHQVNVVGRKHVPRRGQTAQWGRPDQGTGIEGRDAQHPGAGGGDSRGNAVAAAGEMTEQSAHTLPL